MNQLLQPSRRRGSSAAPFDRVADKYDRVFTDTQLGRWLRAEAQPSLAAAFPPGSSVFEIGSGTGEDAVWLAERGVEVLATDPSPAMLRQGEKKARERCVAERIRFVCWNSDQHGEPSEELLKGDGGATSRRFDGAYSGFGALNCVSDRPRLWSRLERWLRPGAALVLVVMGPFCMMETVSSLLRGRPRQAFRRWRSPAVARVGTAALQVWYPTLGRLRTELESAFVLRRAIGIGTALPPSDHARLVDRFSGLLRPVAMIDPWLGAIGGRWIADHYLAWFERRTESSQ